jgi:hypothetical protein
MPLRRFRLAATLVALSLAPRAAVADDTRAPAQALFDGAMKQMAAHDYDHACPALEEVLRLQPGKVGAMLELARCYELSGKTASAWGRYRAAAEAAEGARDPRAGKALAKVEELLPRVPWLLLAVAPANRTSKDFTVQRDGHDVGAAEWDTALPADPGKHTVVAAAPGKKTWTGEVDIPSRGDTVTLTIPTLEDDPNAPRPTVAPDATVAAKPPVWPWIAGGVGVAALIVAIGTGIDGLVASHSLSTLCHGTLSPCAGHTAADIDPLNARKDRGLGLFIGFGLVGAAGVAAGTFGLVTARKQKDARPQGTSLVVTPLLGPGLAGVGIEQRF